MTDQFIKTSNMVRVSDCTEELFYSLRAQLTVFKRGFKTGENGEPIQISEDVKPLSEGVIQWFNALDGIPESLEAKESWLQQSPTAAEVLIITFNDTSKNGAIVIENHGVFTFTVSGDTPWRNYQEKCNLVPALGMYDLPVFYTL